MHKINHLTNLDQPQNQSIRSWYVNFLEKENRPLPEKLLFLILWLLSLIYALVIRTRNFFYDLRILRIYKTDKKVISLGNLSWSGSGKTTLAIYLYEKLFTTYKLSVLRRGYGNDEEKLLKEKNISVFSSRDRVSVVKKMASSFDVFILDDGFQYRKLNRDLNIVIMGTREFKKAWQLLPSGIFREPASSLKRANMLIINYKNEAGNIDEIINQISSRYKNLSIYTANYKLKMISDFKGNKVDAAFFNGKKVAALAAIGYPEGFFNQIKKSGIIIEKTITYPDHHELTLTEFNLLTASLEKESIYNILITQKDKYHIPENNSKINFFILEIEMIIDREDKFLQEIKSYLN